MITSPSPSKFSAEREHSKTQCPPTYTVPETVTLGGVPLPLTTACSPTSKFPSTISNVTVPLKGTMFSGIVFSSSSALLNHSPNLPFSCRSANG